MGHMDDAILIVSNKLWFCLSSSVIMIFLVEPWQHAGLVYEGSEIMKRMKGVRRPIAKERIAFSDFRKTLYGCSYFVDFHKILSKKHSVSTAMCKKACNDCL